VIFVLDTNNEQNNYYLRTQAQAYIKDRDGSKFEIGREFSRHKYSKLETEYVYKVHHTTG
jgi:hypothetical protein